MKTFANFLATLPEEERDYIASLDYDEDTGEHRQQLDIVIAAGGIAHLDSQFWYPYEVIDLGKHFLVEGHESAFVACNGIVLLNISRGNDLSNDLDYLIPNIRTFEPKINQEHFAMLEELGQLATERSEQG